MPQGLPAQSAPAPAASLVPPEAWEVGSGDRLDKPTLITQEREQEGHQRPCRTPDLKGVLGFLTPELSAFLEAPVWELPRPGICGAIERAGF